MQALDLIPHPTPVMTMRSGGRQSRTSGGGRLDRPSLVPRNLDLNLMGLERAIG